MRRALSSAKLMAVMCVFSLSSSTSAGSRASRVRSLPSSSSSSLCLALSSAIRTSTPRAAATLAFLIASCMMTATLWFSSSSLRRLSSSSLSDSSSIALIDCPPDSMFPTPLPLALPGFSTLSHDWCSLPPGDWATSPLLGVVASFRGVAPRAVPTLTLVHLGFRLPGLGVRSFLRGEAILTASSSWTCTDRPGCRAYIAPGASSLYSVLPLYLCACAPRPHWHCADSERRMAACSA
mmetsp:Transcript_30732/g.77445  ORF Transcript_30732/g.77445 Transcript_30732/m.77445 type:complete len:237 (+) Transcript_30732:181-891(+)